MGQEDGTEQEHGNIARKSLNMNMNLVTGNRRLKETDG